MEVKVRVDVLFNKQKACIFDLLPLPLSMQYVDKCRIYNRSTIQRMVGTSKSDIDP